MKIVCISDTHEFHRQIKVPDGDVLIHSGDFSWRGTEEATVDFNEWLGTLPHKHKIFVPGNHDFIFQRNVSMARALLSNATVLIDESVEIDGIKFHGVPWTPQFFNWAFMGDREKMKQVWEAVPEGVDVLITHGPAYGILDAVRPPHPITTRVGCMDLAEALPRIKPKIHVFGHIHESYGQTGIGDTLHINAATCNDRYNKFHDPIVVHL